MRKISRLLLFVILVVAVFSFCSCSNVSENRGRQVNSVNHRGYYEAPENTLSAYRLSAEKGFKMVETDVSFTKDGVAILLHDDTVDRTTNGTGKISELTFEEVSKLDFGSWKSDKYIGEPVPLYSDFINLCKELNLYPYIEIKNGATTEQVDAMVKVVQDNDMTVTWIARNADYLVRCYNLRDNTEFGENDRYGLIVDIVRQSSIDSLSAIDKSKSFIDANYMLLTGAQIRLCKKNEIAIEVWTLDRENQIVNIDPYISGVTSNKVDATKLFETL